MSNLKLIKVLLDRQFYDKYKHKLTKDLFSGDGNVKELFNTVNKAYETLESSLTVDSLKELHYSYNPTLTGSNKKLLEELFAQLSSLDLTPETSELVLKQAIEQNLWTELANISLDGGDSKTVDFLRCQEILDNIREGINLNRDINIVTGSIEEMLAATDQQLKWKIHMTTVADVLEGIGPATFTTVNGRPNAGKTSFVASLIAQPGGFLDQQARVLYIGNEEKAVRTRLRMACCYSGFRREHLLQDNNLKKAKEEFAKVEPYLTVLDMAGFSIEELQNFLKANKKSFDIMVIDQLDKLTINGDYAHESDRIRKLYTNTREMLKRYDLAGIGVGQASVDAENKEVFGFDCLENSKTGKGAEVDVCICLGFRRDDEGRIPDHRTVNFAKNKLTGNESYATVSVDFPTGRWRA